MATNYRNEFCVQCPKFVEEGHGSRLFHEGSWRTFCTTCAAARQVNKNKSVSTAAYINRQPKLFTEEVITMDTNPTTNPEEENKMETKETLFTMTEKQIAYIRDLFKSKKQFMTIYEQESLINKMMGHIDGSAVLTTKWASAAITKLKSYNTERSAS